MGGTLRPRKPPWPLGRAHMLTGVSVLGEGWGRGRAVDIRFSSPSIFPSLFEAQIGSVAEFPYWPWSPR